MDMLNAALMSAEQPSLEKCCDVVDAWHHHMRRIRAGANDGDLMLAAGCGQPAIAAPSVGVDQSTRHGCGLYEGQQAGAGHVLDAASLSVILCARHNQRQGAYYAEQSEESRSCGSEAAVDPEGAGRPVPNRSDDGRSD